LRFPDSCIIRRFTHYRTLSQEDRRELLHLEKAPEAVQAGGLIWREGRAATEFCTLSKGWAYSYRALDNGHRQILEVFLPGDIIGLSDFCLPRRLDGVKMVEEGVICRFSYSHLMSLFERSLNLTTVIFALSAHQHLLLFERLVNLGHHSARQRILLFLHEIYLRLRQTEPGGEASFRLPLTQEELGDLLGMTSVHVSRTLSTLNDANLVHRHHFGITLPDLVGLREECGLPDSHLYDTQAPLLEDLLGHESFAV
jgi:CRP-like cAMP-binding protein